MADKKLNNITIGDSIEMDGENYLVTVIDSSIKIRGRELEYTLPIHRELLEQEFYMRGMNRMVQSFWYAADDPEEQMHELTIGEFEEHENYREELDEFIQEIALEILHVSELAKAREMNVEYFRKIVELEKQLRNSQIKKAS